MLLVHEWMDRPTKRKARHTVSDEGSQSNHFKKDDLFNEWCWDNWAAFQRNI